MSIEWILYLIDVLVAIDNISAVIFIISLIGFILTGIACITMKAEESEEYAIKFMKSLFNKALVFLLLSSSFLIFIPSKQTMYTILGANYLKKSDLPAKVEAVLNKKLDEYLLEQKK